jgi:hypothetical protein
MFIALGLFFFTLFFYLRSLCATFNINDSGETIVDCDLLSLAHSPGYPLHTLWGRIFCLLPLGQPMFRLTFCSAVMGAASVALAYLLLHHILENAAKDSPAGSWFTAKIPALFGALAFAFSYQHWFQSGGGKGSIYTLNNLLAVVMFLILVKMREPGWFKRGFFLSVFFLGLALSVHWETQAVLIPAYAWLLFSAQNRVSLSEVTRNALRLFDLEAVLARLAGAFTSKAGWVRAAALLCLPLSTYLFLPLRSALGPAIDWWSPHSRSRFWTVITRGNYSGTDDPRSLVTLHRDLARFWVHAHDQYGTGFTVLIFALALAGLAWLWRNRRTDAVGLALFGGGVFAGVILHNAPRAGYEWTLDNFFTPFFLATALLAGAGIAALHHWILQRGFQRFAWAPAAAALAAALLPLGLNYPVNDQSAYTVSYDEGMNMLKTAKRGGVILCNGDIDILPLWYLQLAEGKRPDVASFTTQLVGMQWYRDDIVRHWPFLRIPLQGDPQPTQPMEKTAQAVEEMIHIQGASHPFYTTNIFPQGASFLWGHHPYVPDGLLWRLGDTQGQNFAFNSSRLNELWSQYQLRNLNVPERKYWDDYTDVMRDSYGMAASFTGDFAMGNHDPETAQWSYEKALDYRQVQQMGITFVKLGDSELALDEPDSALAHYQESLRWIRSSAYNYTSYAYARIGDCCRIKKDYLNAQEAYEAALKLNPQLKDALQGLEEIQKDEGKAEPPSRS